MSGLENKTKTLRELACETEVTEDNQYDLYLSLEDAQQEINTWKTLLKSDRKIRDDCLLANQEILGRLERIRSLIKEFQAQLTAKAMAGPPSRYQDLWFMVHDFVESLKKEAQLEKEK